VDEHVVFPITAQQFIDDPGLFGEVEKAWLSKSWTYLLGEEPAGAVLATLDEGGITFHYKRQAPT